jgi:5-methylcytosine-specific restriction endonuclease McrA
VNTIEYKRAWRIKNRIRLRAQEQEKRRKNRDKYTKYQSRWYDKHRAQWNSYQMQRLRENPDIRREMAQRRRARRNGNGIVEVFDRQEIWVRDRGICGICKLSVDSDDWEEDHVVPLARGGTHTYDNVQVSHKRCNRKKGAKLMPSILNI